MYLEYHDIVSRIQEPPLWWLDGVPRYDAFTPRDAALYGSQVALIHGECQTCQQRFDVAALPERLDLRDELALYGDLYTLGDAPRHDGCIGETESLSTVAIVEFWERKGGTLDWTRVPALEFRLHVGESDRPARPGLVWLTSDAGLSEEFRLLSGPSGDEVKLAQLLASLGVDDAPRIARLWITVQQQKRLRELAAGLSAFNHHHHARR